MGTFFSKFISNTSEESLITNSPSVKQAFYSFMLLRLRENGIDVHKQIRWSSCRWPFSILLSVHRLLEGRKYFVDIKWLTWSLAQNLVFSKYLCNWTKNLYHLLITCKKAPLSHWFSQWRSKRHFQAQDSLRERGLWWNEKNTDSPPPTHLPSPRPTPAASEFLYLSQWLHLKGFAPVCFL